ncbi:MAG TPA: hypothetical protein VM574_07935 [Terrimicrobiaceae bacterium]|jgi:hypothetical protein|nr:hypothetical protein [Terrimicrobiaceae bacterium]
MKKVYAVMIAGGLTLLVFNLGRFAVLHAQQDEAPSAPVTQAEPRATPQPVGQSFTLGWTDPNPQGKVAGYKVKYGPTSGSYPTVVDVPGQAAPPPAMKTKAFTAIPVGPQFFIVTAYSPTNVQSAPSAELPLIVSIPTPTPTATPTATPTPTPEPTPIPPTNFGVVQMSTRAKVGSGDEQMVASFKTDLKSKVAIRALGPSLPASLKPVKGTTLELRDTNGVFMEANSGWQTGPDAAELTAVHLAPPDAAESALIATVNPGTYNIFVGYTSRTGIGQLEVYRLE